MAALAASDLTYTLVAGTDQTVGDSRYSAQFTVAFGNGSLTYLTGGIPLTKAKLGCPNSLEEVVIVEDAAGDGFLYKYDKSAETIRMYQVPALDGNAAGVQALDELSTDAIAATTLIIKVVGW